MSEVTAHPQIPLTKNARQQRIIDLLGNIDSTNAATANAVTSGAMATTVGVQTADSYAMTGFNAGRV